VLFRNIHTDVDFDEQRSKQSFGALHASVDVILCDG
jgi:hypothetical protein